MINIFFDLDGTLIDCKPRLYNLFQELVGDSKFSFEEYCEIKSNRVDQKTLLQKYFNYSDKQVIEFKKNWLSKIEDEHRIQQDKVFDEVDLSKFSTDYNLFLVTNRQYKNRTINQLKKLGLYDYFKKILVTEQNTNKRDLIKSNVDHSNNDIIIGDTGEDINTGKDLNIRTFAVETGVLKKEILKEYNPEVIVKNIEEFYIRLKNES